MVAPRRRALLAAASLPLLALLAWQAARTYWLCDDAFISFRYVRNLVDGHGLVFNRGERVEGYTNFLWVLELAGLWKVFGIRPEVGCTVLSAIYTAGSLALTVLLALSGPFRDRRAFVAFGAVLLLAASHTWAVWSTSGLETRQFTFFVLLAAVCLQASARRPRLLLLASAALAAGEYTRPEGSLLFACCLAWLAFDRILAKSFRWREIALFCATFVVLVGLHFLWRWGYYGELLPNTYYAKHVRSWPEAGSRYFAAATIEFGLFLLAPAAVLGTVARLRRGDRTHLLGWACILPHVAYVIQIGGDHFEYRVLDFYWPFLAVAAVEGLVALPRSIPALATRRLAANVAAGFLLLVLTLYTSAVQVAKDRATAELDTRQETQKMKVAIRREDHPALFFLPGMSQLMDVYGSLNAYLAPRGVAAPHAEHRFFWRQEARSFAPYEALKGTGSIPSDAVTSRGSIGISGYYLPDLVLIDAKGLTDHHIARLPVQRSNEERYMAHDRSADWPYLEKRGFNLLVGPAAKSPAEALEAANYALRIREDLWMPFDSLKPAWAEAAFRSGPEVRTWKVDRALGCFAEGGLPGWTLEGEAFLGQPRPETLRRPRVHAYRRCPGSMDLDSRETEASRAASGRALSPVFRVPPGGRLEFWLAGARSPSVGARLLRGEEVLHRWLPDNPSMLSPQRLSLRPYEGDELVLCVFDESSDPEGYVVVSDVVLLVPAVLDGS